MEKETQLLSEQMVYDQISEILKQEGMETIQKEAQLFVLKHILDLLHEGQLLTINSGKEIKLWERGGNLQ